MKNKYTKLKISQSFFLIIVLLLGVCISDLLAQNNVGIGTNTPDPSAVLEMMATDKGVLVPRTDTNLVNLAPGLPATGLLIYQNSDNTFYYFDGVKWKPMGSTTSGPQGPTGPAGLNGNNGLPGATGPQGVAGINGTTGTNGLNGATGPQGLPGATGPQGVAGVNGINGVTGPQGPQGIQGVAGTNGINGVTGPQGPQGLQGIQGIQGVQGVSGVGIGIPGPTGPQGPQGVQGPSGVGVGIPGPTGPQGPQGVAGAAGSQGIQGNQGIQGIQGVAGTAGATGPQGTTGPTWTLSSITYNNTGTITVNGTAGSGGPISTTGGSWLTVGNTTTTASTAAIGTTVNSNFIGTTDAQDFAIATNSFERMRIKSDADGNSIRVGIGTSFTTNLIAGSTPSLLHLHDGGLTANDFAQLNLSAAPTTSGARMGALNFAATQSATTDKRTASIESFVTAASATNVTGDLRFFTNNATGATEKMRIQADGNVGINNTTPVHKLHVLQTTTANAGQFENSNAGGDVLSGFNTAASGTGLGAGVVGISQQSGGAGVWGQTSNIAAPGIFGINAAASGAGGGDGIYGQTSQSGGGGVTGLNNNLDGVGVYGINSTASGAGGGIGVYGSSIQSGGAGVYGNNSNIDGPGLIGNHSAVANTGFGDGVEGFTAQTRGFAVWGVNSNTIGSGIVGSAGGSASIIASNGCGVSGNSPFLGVAGYAHSTSTAGTVFRAGGYFASGSDGGSPTSIFSTYAYVGAMTNAGITGNGTTARKIEGTGTVNTVVKDLNDNLIVFSAPEAPENFFEDYGFGELVNGKAHVTLDPIFTKNIAVNEKHPLRAFVQLEGDCNGVYITNKTAEGFDVVELNGGTSNVKFTWHSVANRANETLPDGTVLIYAEERFSKAIGPQTTSSRNTENKNINQSRDLTRNGVAKEPVVSVQE